MKKLIFLIVLLFAFVGAGICQTINYNPNRYIVNGTSVKKNDTATVYLDFSKTGPHLIIENQLSIVKHTLSATYSMQFEEWKTLDGTHYELIERHTDQTAHNLIYPIDTFFFAKQLKFLFINQGADTVDVYNFIQFDKFK